VSEVRWWLRWWVRYFPVLAVRRMVFCSRGHRGPMLDCVVCLTCAAPWFGFGGDDEDD